MSTSAEIDRAINRALEELGLAADLSAGDFFGPDSYGAYCVLMDRLVPQERSGGSDLIKIPIPEGLRQIAGGSAVVEISPEGLKEWKQGAERFRERKQQL